MSRRKQQDEGAAAENGLPKEEEAVLKYVRFNCPTQSTMFNGNEVHYFNGVKAIDLLMASKWGAEKAGEAAKFTTRHSCVLWMYSMMERQAFFRVRRLVSKKDKKEKKQGAAGGDASATASPKIEKKEREETANETEREDDKKVATAEKKDKKQKKVKLEVHSVQTFSDSQDFYVWVFDPTPLYKKIIGLMMVLGTIAGCLFPLWPMWLRQGVYYVSLTGIGGFGAIIVTAILRTILFCAIWAATMGRHKLWVLPNLTEDCGFFESFQPWYSYEYCPGGKSDADGKKKSKKDKKDKDSDEEEEGQERVDGEGERGSATEGSVSDTDANASAPSSPKGEVRKRRAKKADEDYVVVNQ